ncbi:MAG: hypothetical protein OEW35_07980 [Gammaproteobacteria bacterium]|nr:hypothetical protein [Gammaproteobacteria bacterium]MDH4253847.1 hypothetical protein [Gammaproteobacteria bacterium]MDH5310440.1 hypothetical protein [Gammaproteobacteria bacterium]
MDNTITEHDLDATTRQYLQGFEFDGDEADPDLAVDGLSDSLLARLLRLFTSNRA